jgi:hypothetical protein
MALLSMHQKGCSIAKLAQKADKSWPVVRRCLSMAGRVHRFLKNEAQTIPGTASVCLQPQASWTAFTHAFSWAFFPQRF